MLQRVVLLREFRAHLKRYAHCNTQNTATHCNALQYTATHSNSLQCALPREGRPQTTYALLLRRYSCVCSVLQSVAVCCSVLQCVAVCCSFDKMQSSIETYTSFEKIWLCLQCVVPQHLTATHCNTLQHTATRCS